MKRWSGSLATWGSVQGFEYPYMKAGKGRPDPLPQLIDCHREALQEARQRGHQHIVLIGKSMGSRVGCHLALEEPVAALVCLGYPLKGMGKTGKLRDEVLVQLKTPILFVQGTRDSLCPLDLLAEVRPRMQAVNELHVVETGDHSLITTKTHQKQNGVTQDDIERACLAAIHAFVTKSLASGRSG